jgi:hypothetical protein
LHLQATLLGQLPSFKCALFVQFAVFLELQLAAVLLREEFRNAVVSHDGW